jgi:hypothetical protein
MDFMVIFTSLRDFLLFVSSSWPSPGGTSVDIVSSEALPESQVSKDSVSESEEVPTENNKILNIPQVWIIKWDNINRESIHIHIPSSEELVSLCSSFASQSWKCGTLVSSANVSMNNLRNSWVSCCWNPRKIGWAALTACSNLEGITPLEYPVESLDHISDRNQR